MLTLTVLQQYKFVFYHLLCQELLRFLLFFLFIR